MGKDYIYDAEKDTYIGNMSSCLQLARITKHSVSVYRMTTGEIKLGDTEVNNKYLADMSNNMCPESIRMNIRNFTKDAAKVRSCNELIPLICDLMTNIISDNTWIISENQMTKDEQYDVSLMVYYIKSHYKESTWKDNIMLLDILCRKSGIYLFIPHKLPKEWSKDISDNMIYIVCKNPIMVASRLAKYICMEDEADGLLPKLELTHDRSSPLVVTDKMGAVLENASLYSIIDSRFKGYVMKTKLDTNFIDSHVVLEGGEFTFAYHLKGLVLLDSIDEDDRNLAVYSIRKPGQYQSDTLLRDSVKMDIISDTIRIPEIDTYGNLYDVTDITHKVLLDNNEADRDLVWLRRFHKYYTLLTCISSITGILSVFKIFTSKTVTKKEDIDNLEKVHS